MPDNELNEFEDYLLEFESVPKFDAELCPICGIVLSDSLSVNKIPLIELQFENETVAKRAIIILESEGIKSKKSSSGKDKILVPEEKLEEVKLILNP